ncbi:MAG TPA: ATP-binding cassette domain-containing protein, partial [bacterium]|nr:ATP-binding cassette domain-containing protein [bacterium]
ERRFAEIVSGLGLSGLLDRRPGAISGGEAQRVALGRALLAGTGVLLLDECTSALDGDTREAVGWLVDRERRARGLAVVQVTHDLEEARRLADAIVAMEEGRLTGVVPRRDRSAIAEPATGGTR